MSIWQERLDLAVEVARQAGDLLEEGLGKVRNVSTKESAFDLVTEFDRSSQELILNRLMQAYPEDHVLAEEQSRNKNKKTQWIVDPLDGTTNFLHRFPYFSVSIAYKSQGRVVLGVVHAPCLSMTFTAISGEGARLNGQSSSASNSSDLKSALLATGFPYDPAEVDRALGMFSGMVRQAQGIRRIGSAALDLCFVGNGYFDGLWELGLKPWDVAAGILVVREAGGTVTQIDGRPFDLSESGNILATNGNIHESLSGKLQE
ncbi:MAG: inositol monophosphatase family protein [Candidatus Bipolaricaulota bacterium]